MLQGVFCIDWTTARLVEALAGSRSDKVFGIGVIKTGTTSLGRALQMLGYDHTHERRQRLLENLRQRRLAPLVAWAARHDSFEDWPWPFVYEQMATLFPESRFVLTTRKSERAWLESVKRHAALTGPTLGREMFFGHAMPFGHENRYLRVYRAFNARVRRYFRRSPERLVEVCWEAGDGWDTLCDFLGREPPNVEFPHLNSAAAQARTGCAKALQ